MTETVRALVSARDLELAEHLWKTELLGVPMIANSVPVLQAEMVSRIRMTIAEYLAVARAEGVAEEREGLRKRLEAWFRYNEKS